MEIRSYRPSDRIACLDIFDSNCPQYFDRDEREGLKLWLTGLDSGQIAYNNSAADYFYVLLVDGIVVACGGFYIARDDKQARIAWGMVSNTLHKRGYGKALLEFRIKEIRNLYPGHAIALDTSQHTFRFFEGMGFIVTKITPSGYGPGLDRYDMLMRGAPAT